MEHVRARESFSGALGGARDIPNVFHVALSGNAYYKNFLALNPKSQCTKHHYLSHSLWLHLVN